MKKTFNIKEIAEVVLFALLMLLCAKGRAQASPMSLEPKQSLKQLQQETVDFMTQRAAEIRSIRQMDIDESVLVYKPGINPVKDMKTPVPPVLVNTYSTGIRQTIVFTPVGNTYLITTIRLSK